MRKLFASLTVLALFAVNAQAQCGAALGRSYGAVGVQQQFVQQSIPLGTLHLVPQAAVQLPAMGYVNNMALNPGYASVGLNTGLGYGAVGLGGYGGIGRVGLSAGYGGVGVAVGGGFRRTGVAVGVGGLGGVNVNVAARRRAVVRVR
jgi:hypothetical protein